MSMNIWSKVVRTSAIKAVRLALEEAWTVGVVALKKVGAGKCVDEEHWRHSLIEY